MKRRLVYWVFSVTRELESNTHRRWTQELGSVTHICTVIQYMHLAGERYRIESFSVLLSTSCTKMICMMEIIHFTLQDIFHILTPLFFFLFDIV
jgi:hypothetical protein